MMLARARAIALLVTLAVATEVGAQRCALVPTYTSSRLSIGYLGTSHRGGVGHGLMLRGVRNAMSVEGRAESFGAHWFEPFGTFVGGTSYPASGKTGGFTVRRSSPLGDGLAALCLVAEYNSTRVDFDQGSDAMEHRELALGVGVGVQFRLSGGTPGSFLVELRRASHFVDYQSAPPCCTNQDDSSVGAEITLGAALAVSRNMTVALSGMSPFYNRRSAAAPKWRAHGSPNLRLTVAWHFDSR